MNDRPRVTFTIASENERRLKELSDRTRIPMSRLVDEALELLSIKYRKEGK